MSVIIALLDRAVEHSFIEPPPEGSFHGLPAVNGMRVRSMHRFQRSKDHSLALVARKEAVVLARSRDREGADARLEFDFLTNVGRSVGGGQKGLL